MDGTKQFKKLNIMFELCYYVMNNTICRATKKTPYELVFGMHLHSDNIWMGHLFENKNCIDEEDLLNNINIEQEIMLSDSDEISLIIVFLIIIHVHIY